MSYTNPSNHEPNKTLRKCCAVLFVARQLGGSWMFLSSTSCCLSINAATPFSYIPHRSRLPSHLSYHSYNHPITMPGRTIEIPNGYSPLLCVLLLIPVTIGRALIQLPIEAVLLVLRFYQSFRRGDVTTSTQYIEGFSRARQELINDYVFFISERRGDEIVQIPLPVYIIETGVRHAEWWADVTCDLLIMIKGKVLRW